MKALLALFIFLSTSAVLAGGEVRINSHGFPVIEQVECDIFLTAANEEYFEELTDEEFLKLFEDMNGFLIF